MLFDINDETVNKQFLLDITLTDKKTLRNKNVWSEDSNGFDGVRFQVSEFGGGG